MFLTLAKQSSGPQRLPDEVELVRNEAYEYVKRLDDEPVYVDVEVENEIEMNEDGYYDDDRYYNLDLCTKLHWAVSPFVDILVQSGVYRYLEFKALERSYLISDEGKISSVLVCFVLMIGALF